MNIITRLVSIAILLVLMGCARITIERDVKGVKSKAVYWRAGSQNLENLKVEFDSNGNIKGITLGKQHSSDLTKALKALNTVIKKLPIIPIPIK